MQDKAINSILTSSLSVELVYIILKSITRFSHKVDYLSSEEGVLTASMK